jgi:YVTN family beta-propeller protein
MKTISTTKFFLAIVAILVFNSCKKESDNAVKGAFSNGIFIVNEGQYSGGTGTITYFNPDSNYVKQDIFEAINNRPLGNVAQSMTIFNGKGYIVVNNAGKVEVVDAATFKSEGTITNLHNPSQFLPINGEKAYVSDWIGNIAVIDLKNNTITKTITAGTGPDAMLKSGDYVYVSNTGGFSIDSTISVIDFTTDKLVKVIPVGNAPAEIVADGNGKIWVICKGKGYTGYSDAGDLPGRIISIDPNSLEVDFTYKFTASDLHPEKMVINNQKSMVYFLYNYGIYQFNLLSANAVPEKMFGRSFYSLGYENKTGFLYAADVKNYTSNGIVLRIKPETAITVDSVETGIIPRGFAFPE